jgi:protein-tyrosine phosphatase
MKKVAVVFVCMGNICRSPTAEAVFRQYVERAGLAGQIVIDSAGTHDYHIGEPPDSRTQRAAQQRGFDMTRLRGRQVEAADFSRFDYVLAMDAANLRPKRARPKRACSSTMRIIMSSAKCPIRITAARTVSSACWIWWKMRRLGCCSIYAHITF